MGPWRRVEGDGRGEAGPGAEKNVDLNKIKKKINKDVEVLN